MPASPSRTRSASANCCKALWNAAGAKELSRSWCAPCRRTAVARVGVTDSARKPKYPARVGPTHEWHVDLRKPKGKSDMGKAGLSWEDGAWQPLPHRQGG